MTTYVKMTGVQECLAVLQATPAKAQKVWLRKSVRAGGGPLLKAVRANVPVKNGGLKRSLRQLVRVYRGTVVAVIGQEKGKADTRKRKIKAKGGISGRGDVVPMHLVEQRVKPHKITGKREKNSERRIESFTVHKDTRKRFTRASSEGARKTSIRRAITRKVAVGKVLKPLAIGEREVKFRTFVQHPGHSGKGFARAAAATTSAKAAQEFETKLVAEIMADRPTSTGGGVANES